MSGGVVLGGTIPERFVVRAQGELRPLGWIILGYVQALGIDCLTLVALALLLRNDKHDGRRGPPNLARKRAPDVQERFSSQRMGLEYGELKEDGPGLAMFVSQWHPGCADGGYTKSH